MAAAFVIAMLGFTGQASAQTAVDLEAGEQHTCAVLSDGTVRCWGDGGDGRLGYGGTADIGDDEHPGAAGPVDLGAGRTAQQVATHDLHTCALLDDGTVRCWGDASEGQLGYGNTNDIGDDPGETPGDFGPVDLGAGRTAIQIAVGGRHSCALLDNHTVRCWGSGFGGRLGYGNETTIGDNAGETPGTVGPVDLGAGRTAASITAGAAYTCAVLDDAAVRCWGVGGVGQLGYGNTLNIGDTETPGSVGPVNLGAGRTALEVNAANGHTCAVLDDTTARCWGAGSLGRRGYGNTTDVSNPASLGPIDLGSGRTADSISGGGFHTCAVLDDAAVRCWGAGGRGRLGYGNETNIGDNAGETPGTVGPVDLGAGRTAQAVSAGGFHTCAILDNGTVRCWGSGLEGALGLGNETDIGDTETPGSVPPVDLVDDPPLAVDDSASVGEDDAATPIDVLANDQNADGGPLTVDLASDPANGTVAITGGGTALTYEPDPNYCNTDAAGPGSGPDDTFTYTLNGGSVGTVSVTVTCADDAPAAVDDAAALAEDAMATAIDVLANDQNADGGPLTVDLTSDPANGAVAITGGGSGLTYAPDPDYCNEGGPADTFTYTLNGGAVGIVSVSVTCVEDPITPAAKRRCKDAEPTITGTDGDDELVGTEGPDLIKSLGGDDSITALGGDDVICAGAGDDRASGGAGADTLRGGEDNDDLRGGGGADFLHGSDGKDELVGGGGKDRCSGGAGKNKLRGCERE